MNGCVNEKGRKGQIDDNWNSNENKANSQKPFAQTNGRGTMRCPRATLRAS